MLAHVPSFGRNPRGSPDFLAYPVPKACMHVLGTRVPRRLGVARSASSPKAAQALGCSLTPGLRISFGRVTCMARAASVPGLRALGFLLLCGVCVWVRFKLVFPPWAWHLLLRPTEPHAPPSTSPHCNAHSRRDNSAQSWTLVNPKNVVSRDHYAAVPAAPSVTTTTTGCLGARAAGTRFPTVVRRLCLGPVGGWVWVLLTPPVLRGVLGGCVWARFVVLSL